MRTPIRSQPLFMPSFQRARAYCSGVMPWVFFRLRISPLRSAKAYRVQTVFSSAPYLVTRSFIKALCIELSFSDPLTGLRCCIKVCLKIQIRSEMAGFSQFGRKPRKFRSLGGSLPCRSSWSSVGVKRCWRVSGVNSDGSRRLAPAGSPSLLSCLFFKPSGSCNLPLPFLRKFRCGAWRRYRNSL